MNGWNPERLPQDPEAEQSLLATCCAPGGDLAFAEVIFGLAEEDFVVPKHRAVFKALKGLVEQRIEVNALTLKDALDQAGALATVEGFAGLTELMAAPEVGRPQVLADLVRRKTKLRKLVRLGAGLAKQASLEEETPELLVDQAAEGLFRLAQGEAGRRGLLPIDQVASEAMQRIHDRLEGRHSSGIRVGMSTLDALTQGFQPGNLIVLAARPGIGKTALALNWLMRSAMHHGVCGAFFSLEMSHEEVFLRLLSSHAEINMKKVMAGHATPEEERRLYGSRDALVHLPIHICDQASITVPQIQNMVVKQGTQSNRKVELVVVDYLQLVSSPENSRAAKQNEATRVGEISRGLKLLAKDHGVPVVVLSQLNREVEHRQGGRPQLSDLRDSGAIEQDADMVAFIHRKMVAVQEGQEPDPSAELVIAKHRNGPTRIIPLYFEAGHATYHEMALGTGSGGM